MISRTLNEILDSNKTVISTQENQYQSQVDKYLSNIMENVKAGNIEIPEFMRKKLIQLDMLLRQKNFEDVSYAKL